MFKNLRGDIFGGITAGVVALPLALAFGVQSGLGAEAGLYGAIMLGFFAALLGGTPSQVSGPTGPMTVVSALVIATALKEYGGLEAGLPYIIATFLLAGFFQILFGFSRIGQYVRYIPYPVISGFMSGIGVIIILMQLFPVLGHVSPTRVFDIVLVLHEPLQDINWYAVGMTVSTLLIIYLVPYVTKAIPSSLIALVVLTVGAVLMGVPVPKIGDIPVGFPDLKLDLLTDLNWMDIRYLFIPAVTLAALGALDSLLTSVVADNLTKTKHDSNKELVGQGIGNMIGACFAGLPGAGATMRTVVNINAGGRQQLSGMIHSVMLLAILLGFAKYAAQIPLSVLAGILISVGISIIDYRGFKHLLHVPRTDALVMLSVLVLTVFVDLLQAVAVGMILSSVLFMKEMGDITEESARVAPLQDFQSELPWDDEEYLPENFKQSVYIKHLEGPLFFGFTSHFQQMVTQIPNVHYVVIRMKHVPYIDQSGLYAIEDAVLYLKSKNIKVLLTGVQGQPMDMLKLVKLVPNLVSEQECFGLFEDCVRWLKSEVRKNG